MPRKDEGKGRNVAIGKNGHGDWEEEEVFRREGTPPETLSESLESQLELERQRALRVMADFENHRRRVEKERETLVLYANEKLLKEFLPVLDDMERAVAQAEAGGTEQTLASFVLGVRLILNRIVGVLERSGVKAFDAVGEPFDPTVHEAVMQRMEKDAPASSVLEELERGYMLYNRLLRPTRAVVNALRAPRPVPEPVPEPAPMPEPAPETEDSAPEFDVGDVAEDTAAFEDTGEEPAAPADDAELTGGAFEIDEDALGSLDDWEKEFSD
ncbi:MAG: nucleotide exchange factor GrpE [Pseudomonadota bacterium]